MNIHQDPQFTPNQSRRFGGHAALALIAICITAGLAATIALPPAAVHAQQAGRSNDDDPGSAEERRGNPTFWQAELGGGHYMVRLDRVASISRHQYVVDAAARVIEVTVTTNSSAVARFYYLEPVTAGGAMNIGRGATQRVQDVADEASRRVTGQGAAQVVKNYPASTHAHTIEYVIPSLAQLDSLYNSLRDAMETGRGRVWVGTGG